MSVYTVGNETNYNKGLKELGPEFMKLGRRTNYPGGFAVQTPADAARLIDEMGKAGEWAIYELEADWKQDTRPSENGWWHALINDSVILRKVPRRYQRRRSPGWKMPEGCVYVGRPTKWGNPFRTAEQFDRYLSKVIAGENVRLRTPDLEHLHRIAADLEELRGKNVACWCSLDKECHADVLLGIANRESNPQTNLA